MKTEKLKPMSNCENIDGQCASAWCDCDYQRRKKSAPNKPTIPSGPKVESIGGQVFRLSEPVIVDGVDYYYVTWRQGLGSLFGEDSFDVFVCDHDGVVANWTGLCHNSGSYSGPKWLFALRSK